MIERVAGLRRGWAGLGDIQVPNDRPIREVAVEILTWLGWV
jgi:hypothetical protein